MSAAIRPPNIDRPIGILVALLAVLAYWPALWNGFVDWDDPIYVTQNSTVAAGLTASGIRYAVTTFDSHNWIPLTWISYELDVSLFGLNPAAFHAVNVFWHTLNVWLLFHAIRRLTGSIHRGAVVAALFAVHPLHVESVAWISERKDVISTCALLLTLLAYQRYAARPSIARYIPVCCLMALGLLAKSMLVTLPLLLCLVDYWPLQRARLTPGTHLTTGDARRSPWQLLLEKVPLLVLALADGAITLAAQKSAMTASGILPLPRRLGNACIACGWYLWKTVWPVGLSPFYQHPRESLSVALVGGSAALLIAMTAWVLIRGMRYRDLVFGWGWFLIALLPVIGFVQVGTQAYADRYAYVPHIGLFTLVVWEVDRWMPQWRFARRVKIGLAALVIGVCAGLTHAQIAVWHDSESLWTRAIALDPYNAIAHLQLGQKSLKNKDWDAAQEHFANVMVYRPSDPDAILNLGYIHQQRQEWNLAAEYYLWLLRLNPRHAVAAQNLASLPPPTEGTSSERTPATLTEQNKLGLRHARRGEMQSALRLFQEAADLDPQDVLSQNLAATALEELNRPNEAARYYDRALRAKPADVEARHGLDRIHKRQSQQ